MQIPRFLILALLLSAPATFGQESMNAAMRAYNAGNFDAAVKLFVPLANKGDPVAQLRLGTLYYAGKGVQENEKMAVALFTKSANQGNTEAMLQLGNAFTFGTETPSLVADPDIEAARWYFKAASAGNADAQYSLGLMFMAGKGVEKDQSEAARWMKLAAKSGHKDAQSFVNAKGQP